MVFYYNTNLYFFWHQFTRSKNAVSPSFAYLWYQFLCQFTFMDFVENYTFSCAFGAGPVSLPLKSWFI